MSKKFALFIGRTVPDLSVEIILSVLLANFKFSPAKAEVVWNMGGIKYPTVGHESDDPKMPMYVERI